MVPASRVVQVAGAAALSLLLIGALTGCGSSPRTRFYTLNPVPGTSRTPAGNQAPVKIAAVHIPGVLDRTSIIRGESNYTLDISSQDRWGADLAEMIRATLTQDLQQRLPAGMVIAPRSPAPQNGRGLVVDILHFGPDASGHFRLEATWTLQAGSPARVLVQRAADLTDPAAQPVQVSDTERSSSAAAQAAAMSALLGHLADDIASGLSQLSASQR